MSTNSGSYIAEYVAIATNSLPIRNFHVFLAGKVFGMAQDTMALAIVQERTAYCGPVGLHIELVEAHSLKTRELWHSCRMMWHLVTQTWQYFVFI